MEQFLSQPFPLSQHNVALAELRPKKKYMCVSDFSARYGRSALSFYQNIYMGSAFITTFSPIFLHV